MPRADKRSFKFLAPESIHKLIAAAINPHHRMMIRLALQTGLRREEIATFPIQYLTRPEYNDRKFGNIRVDLDPSDGFGMLTKGSKSREIYISSRFMEDLKRYAIQYRGERSNLTHNTFNPLFLNKFGNPFSADGKGIERIVRNIGKRVNLKVFPHMLRHTYATQTLIKLQQTCSGMAPIIYLQQQLGHASINTTMDYLHLINETADNAVLLYDDELNNEWSEADAEA